MAGRQWRVFGGTRGLLELIAEHAEAVEYDLIGLGLRLDWLGSEWLSWRDLLVIVNQSPVDSALFRAMHPEDAVWGLKEQLLAVIADALHGANWQRSGGTGARPKPIRPSDDQPKKQYGAKPLPMDEMARRLGWEVTD